MAEAACADVGCGRRGQLFVCVIAFRRINDYTASRAVPDDAEILAARFERRACVAKPKVMAAVDDVAFEVNRIAVNDDRRRLGLRDNPRRERRRAAEYDRSDCDSGYEL
jgi:hypothetical protein